MGAAASIGLSKRKRPPHLTLLVSRFAVCEGSGSSDGAKLAESHHLPRAFACKPHADDAGSVVFSLRQPKYRSCAGKDSAPKEQTITIARLIH
jgi:hypothetical protein